jgi:hypothetical protein
VLEEERENSSGEDMRKNSSGDAIADCDGVHSDLRACSGTNSDF